MQRASNSAAGRSIAALLASAALMMCGVLASDADPEPYWPRRFSVAFNETTKLVFSWHTSGTWVYDADAGVELVRRLNGRGDRYCKTIHPFTDTPCNHLVTGGKRYLIFPELGECCMCCTAEAGCGILSPNWLEGAEYEGVVQMAGATAYKWNKKGVQPNYYYSTADTKQVPVELDQVPNDFQTFDRSSFTTQATDLSLFQVPHDCADRCPLASICSVLQSRQAFAPTSR